ncbi:hypothetical protein SmJEL517_g05080 [Synchytrium microbalum]|uniref:COX assembly mitochondrial protein n=1 Tax=Synchytrium microbalum TaxID=1806994 RepID=A0A507C2A0_9FUNG|nr:uncharacterized protein SmJEL517_g05080 [Synchytrium microbalum]TPX31665.1 hypothetical protein SmJEL517_g05080 [Synchytrium microbalum]
MTRPEACESVGTEFRSCVDRVGFWGRLKGDCEALKVEFESCMSRELQKRRSESLETARERKKNWKERNQAAGLPAGP